MGTSTLVGTGTGYGADYGSMMSPLVHQGVSLGTGLASMGLLGAQQMLQEIPKLVTYYLPGSAIDATTGQVIVGPYPYDLTQAWMFPMTSFADLIATYQQEWPAYLASYLDTL
jgi:hypothetical protein